VSAFLITGAGGFVGRALAADLRARGDTVIGLSRDDGDIAEPATLRAHSAAKIDHVFHLAARTFVPQSWDDPAGFHRVNTGGTLNVLELCREWRIPLTHVSAYLYGMPKAQPIREDHPLAPNNPYALSKALAEQACAFYARVHGLPVTVIRPFNIYGPGQAEHFLIPSILRQVLEADCIEVKDLAPKRDFLYIDDLIELFLATLRPPAGYNVYNAGTGISRSVAEVIAAAQAEAATSKPVQSLQVSRVQEIDDTRADIAKAHRELGWSPKHAFRDGLRATINAMQEAT
jgi:nucleoside-diphosphate-sugar epimerase